MFVYVAKSTKSKQNICSVLLERGCSEIEKLEGEVSFLRENFSFPRSDSCLTERSEVQTVQIEEKKSSLEEKKSLRVFASKRTDFPAARILFFCF